ncbi:tyrosine-type recombinase/integrase [Desulfuribacillus alkaliarsenatis]|uniref:Integrase n=1 Tax=Desulfuribacillus alkaliarsenatis TaxID=766136 RepID=A0A1E5FZJ2_9FIRM|nr:tyrosine-type recombinase/integrase [Desulfuribacillus alkaliarsenatis]OEF95997.1 hypothetical protein BHF68_09610 [Desulfuribacillus alkaliarsenatis]
MSDFLNKLSIKQQRVFNNLIKELPAFCEIVVTTKFVIEGRLRSTIIHYMRDWHLFFQYCVEHLEQFQGKKIKELTNEDINSITYDNLVYFEQWLLNDRNVVKSTQSRRRSAIKVLFNTLYKKNILKQDPTIQYDKLKINKQGIIALAPHEQVSLLDAIESGYGLTDKEKKSRTEFSIARDLALITLLLDTGLRIGEVYTLNRKNFNFDNMEISVLGKGAKVRTVVFSSDTKTSLLAYLKHPTRLSKQIIDKEAIFLNRDYDRLSIRGMQKIVKKYASAIGKYNITPHKLRSSAGLSLYEATGDIRVVAAQLGHEDISVTAKKYVDASKHKLHDAIRKRGSLR